MKQEGNMRKKNIWRNRGGVSEIQIMPSSGWGGYYKVTQRKEATFHDAIQKSKDEQRQSKSEAVKQNI